MGERGSVDEASVSEKAPWRVLGRGAPSLGNLKDTLKKSQDTGISLHRGPFPSEGNLVFGGGAHIPGTLKVITLFVENVVLRRKSQSTFCECEALTSLRHI